MLCSLRSVLFHTRRGHLASKHVSDRGRSLPVTKQMTTVPHDTARFDEIMHIKYSKLMSCLERP